MSFSSFVVDLYDAYCVRYAGKPVLDIDDFVDAGRMFLFNEGQYMDCPNDSFYGVSYEDLKRLLYETDTPT